MGQVNENNSLELKERKNMAETFLIATRGGFCYNTRGYLNDFRQFVASVSLDFDPEGCLFDDEEFQSREEEWSTDDIYELVARNAGEEMIYWLMAFLIYKGILKPELVKEWMVGLKVDSSCGIEDKRVKMLKEKLGIEYKC